MGTYQAKTLKFREALELKMGNPEPNPSFRKQTNKSSKSENQKRLVLIIPNNWPVIHLKVEFFFHLWASILLCDSVISLAMFA